MGTTFSLLGQFYPPKPKWWQKDIPDLTGKVMIVTGTSSASLHETVKALLQHNAKVYIAARGREDTERVIQELNKKTGRTAIFVELDLADLASVRHAAEDFLSQEKELHVLFNNAGVMWPTIDLLTKDGYDLQWGVHVVGAPSLWTLLPPLRGEVLSGTQAACDLLLRAYLEAHHLILHDSPGARIRLPPAYYKQLVHLVVTARAREALRQTKTYIAVALNPGSATKCPFQAWLFVSRTFSHPAKSMLHPVDPYGALTQLYAGTSPAVINGKNGAFFIPWAREGPTPPGALKPDVGGKLWDYVEKEVEGRRRRRRER
ncbi:NAD(P)-binding protein [Mycena galericulata]|nr:NAD(P)-binding protein [Mycena galericulata]